MIALKGVSVGKALKDVSLAIRPKECLCVTGRSDAELTALFRILATLEKPEAGSVEVDNVDMSVLPAPVLQLFRSRLGLVFRPPLVIPYLTLGQNVALPLHLRGLKNNLIAKAADDLLKRLGLTAKASLLPRDLNEEELQLACLARCLISAPLVIVAHDPFDGLSDQAAHAAATLFQNLRKKGATLIFLSQDERAARLMGVSPAVLAHGTLRQQYAEAPDAVPQKTEPPSAATEPAVAQEPEAEDIAVHAVRQRAVRKQVQDAKEPRKIHITSIGSGLS